MPAHNQLTSTIIDDEELIDELRKYGEKNLPLIGASTSTRRTKGSSSSSNQLTDQNREIYLKKLNHYKAREKVETNPSKQYLKQQNFRNSLDNKRISHIYKPPDETHTINDDDDEDIIEIDSKNATSEYVQVSNANTSPLSTSDYDQTLYVRPTSSASAQQNQLQSAQLRNELNPPNYSNYVKLKDRLDLDKTLSKYRSEINSILSESIARNRNTESIASKLYTQEQRKEADAKTVYCPRPEPTNLIGSIRSRLFSPKQVELKTHNPYDSLKNIRGIAALRQDDVSSQINIRKTNDENLLTTGFSNLGLYFFKALPYLVLILFALIAISYINVKFLNNVSESIVTSGTQRQDISVDDSTTRKQREHFYCADVKDIKCSDTKELLKELVNYLRAKSGSIDCSNVASDVKLKANDNELSVDFIEKCVHINKVADYLVNNLNLVKNQADQQEAIDSMLKAISKNPHWKIRLLDNKYSDASDTTQVTYLMSEVSSKSLMCRVRELVHFVWVRVIMFSSILFTLVCGYVVYSKLRIMNIEKDKEYYDLITRVTAMVEQHYELSLLDPSNIKPYIAISHIHDHLFTPSERASRKKLWNKVVEFIQNNESRIRLETQFINGEETNVWRWIVPKHDPSLKFPQTANAGIGLANSTMMPNSSETTMKPVNRIYPNLPSSQASSSVMTQDSTPHQEQNLAQLNGWQGDAFNRADRLAHSPTPCLKIRNMFDASSIENDPLMAIRIHNDILDKCSGVAPHPPVILHIACDKKSKEGCVYIKCNSNDSAGAVYQMLNGTWYNGKLLNVKFLRSDRYLERFPDSKDYTQQIRPIHV